MSLVNAEIATSDARATDSPQRGEVDAATTTTNTSATIGDASKCPDTNISSSMPSTQVDGKTTLGTNTTIAPAGAAAPKTVIRRITVIDTKKLQKAGLDRKIAEVLSQQKMAKASKEVPKAGSSTAAAANVATKTATVTTVAAGATMATTKPGGIVVVKPMIPPKITITRPLESPPIVNLKPSQMNLQIQHLNSKERMALVKNLLNKKIMMKKAESQKLLPPPSIPHASLVRIKDEPAAKGVADHKVNPTVKPTVILKAPPAAKVYIATKPSAAKVYIASRPIVPSIEKIENKSSTSTAATLATTTHSKAKVYIATRPTVPSMEKIENKSSTSTSATPATTTLSTRQTYPSKPITGMLTSPAGPMKITQTPMVSLQTLKKPSPAKTPQEIARTLDFGSTATPKEPPRVLNYGLQHHKKGGATQVPKKHVKKKESSLQAHTHEQNFPHGDTHEDSFKRFVSNRQVIDDDIPKASIRNNERKTQQIHASSSSNANHSFTGVNYPDEFPEISPLKQPFPTTNLPKDTPLPTISSFKRPTLPCSDGTVPPPIKIESFDFLPYEPVDVQLHHQFVAQRHSTQAAKNLIVLENKVLSQEEKIDLNALRLAKSKTETISNDMLLQATNNWPAEVVVKEEFHGMEEFLPIVPVKQQVKQKFIIATDKFKMTPEKIAAMAKQIKRQISVPSGVKSRAKPEFSPKQQQPLTNTCEEFIKTASATTSSLLGPKAAQLQKIPSSSFKTDLRALKSTADRFKISATPNTMQMVNMLAQRTKAVKINKFQEPTPKTPFKTPAIANFQLQNTFVPPRKPAAEILEKPSDSTLSAVDFIASLSSANPITEETTLELSAEELNLNASFAMNLSPLRIPFTQHKDVAIQRRKNTSDSVNMCNVTDATDMVAEMFAPNADVEIGKIITLKDQDQDFKSKASNQEKDTGDEMDVGVSINEEKIETDLAENIIEPLDQNINTSATLSETTSLNKPIESHKEVSTLSSCSAEVQTSESSSNISKDNEVVKESMQPAETESQVANPKEPVDTVEKMVSPETDELQVQNSEASTSAMKTSVEVIAPSAKRVSRFKKGKINLVQRKKSVVNLSPPKIDETSKLVEISTTAEVAVDKSNVNPTLTTNEVCESSTYVSDDAKTDERADVIEAISKTNADERISDTEIASNVELGAVDISNQSQKAESFETHKTIEVESSSAVLDEPSAQPVATKTDDKISKESHIAQLLNPPKMSRAFRTSSAGKAVEETKVETTADQRGSKARVSLLQPKEKLDQTLMPAQIPFKPKSIEEQPVQAPIGINNLLQHMPSKTDAENKADGVVKHVEIERIAGAKKEVVKLAADTKNTKADGSENIAAKEKTEPERLEIKEQNDTHCKERQLTDEVTNIVTKVSVGQSVANVPNDPNSEQIKVIEIPNENMTDSSQGDMQNRKQDVTCVNKPELTRKTRRSIGAENIAETPIDTGRKTRSSRSSTLEREMTDEKSKPNAKVVTPKKNKTKKCAENTDEELKEMEPIASRCRSNSSQQTPQKNVSDEDLEFLPVTPPMKLNNESTLILSATNKDTCDEETAKDESSQELDVPPSTSRKRLRKTLEIHKKRVRILDTDTESDDNGHHDHEADRALDSCEFLGFDETSPSNSKMQKNLSLIIAATSTEEDSCDEMKKKSKSVTINIADEPRQSTEKPLFESERAKPLIEPCSSRSIPLKKRWELSRQNRDETDITDDTSPAQDEDDEEEYNKLVRISLAERSYAPIDATSEIIAAKKLKLSVKINERGTKNENSSVSVDFKEKNEEFIHPQAIWTNKVKVVNVPQQKVEKGRVRGGGTKSKAEEIKEGIATTAGESEVVQTIDLSLEPPKTKTTTASSIIVADTTNEKPAKRRGRKRKADESLSSTNISVKVEEQTIEPKDECTATADVTDTMISTNVTPIKTPAKRGRKPKSLNTTVSFDPRLLPKKSKTSFVDTETENASRVMEVNDTTLTTDPTSSAELSKVPDVSESKRKKKSEVSNTNKESTEPMYECTATTDVTNTTISTNVTPIATPAKRGRKPNSVNKNTKNEASKTINEPVEPNNECTATTDVTNTTISTNVTPIVTSGKRGRKFKPTNDTPSFDPRLLLITHRAQLKTDDCLTNQSNANSGPLQCGLCLDYTTKPNWMRHLATHYGVGWIVGQAELNVYSRGVVLAAIQNFMKSSVVKKLQCRMCEKHYCSALGLLMHIEMCGEPQVRVVCERCMRDYSKLSMPSHLRTCTGPDQEKKKLTEQSSDEKPENQPVVMNNFGRAKRASLMKAESMLKVIGEQLVGASTNEAKFEPKDHIKYYSANTADIKQQRLDELQSSGKVGCPEKACTFSAESIESLEDHVENCNLVPKIGYHCLLCQNGVKVFASKKEAISHVRRQHRPTAEAKDFEADASDCGIKTDDETSDDDISSGVDSKEDDLEEDDAGDLEPVSNVSKSKSKKKRKKVKKPFVSASSSCHRVFPYRDSNLRKTVAHKWKTFTKHNYTRNMLYPYALPTFSIVNDSDNLAKCLPAQNVSMRYAFNKNHKIAETLGVPETMEWAELKRFEAAEMNDNKIIFVGGPIKSLAWVPLPPKVNEQYLAVSYRKDVNKYTRCLSASCDTLILLYKIDKHDERQPCQLDLHYALRIRDGPVHSMAFLPSGGYAPDDNRLGVLAVGASNANIKMYALPITLDAKANGESLTVIDVEPALVLSLELQAAEPTKHAFTETQCLQICWSETLGHQHIFAGYANGCIGIWDISEDENLNCFVNAGLRQFTPLNYFYVGEKGLRSLAIHYDTRGPRWLAAASFARRFFVYDIRVLTQPLSLKEDTLKNVIRSIDWPVMWEPLLVALCDAIPNFGRCSLSLNPVDLVYHHIKIDNMLTAVSQAQYTPCTNQYVCACDNGDIVILDTRELHLDEIHNRKRLKKSRVISVLDIKRLNGEQLVQGEELLPVGAHFHEDDYRDKYGLVFSPLVKFPTENQKYLSEKRRPPYNIEHYMRINSLRCNLNDSASHLLAVGYENGFLRIEKFNKYL